MTQVGSAGTAEVESAACSLGDCCSVQLSYVPANPTHAHRFRYRLSLDIGSETAAGFEPARGLSTVRICSPSHSSALPYRLATGTPTLRYIVSYRSLDICFAIAACWRRQIFSSSDTLVRVCCSSRYVARVSVDIEEDRRPSSRSVGGPSRGAIEHHSPFIDCGGMSTNRLPSLSQAADVRSGVPTLALIRALAAIGTICSRVEHHMFPQYSLRFR